MREKSIRVRLAKSGEVSVSPEQAKISIEAQDFIAWESPTPFRVIAVRRRGKKRGAPTGPFFRPFPRRGDPFRNRVNSGPAREGTQGSYKVTLEFHNRKRYDPIIIINT